jgi:penicillin-binding protein 1C
MARARGSALSSAADINRARARATRRRIAVATSLALCGLLGVFGYRISERAHLVAPAATPILYDRHGAFLSQIGFTGEIETGEKRIDYGYWPLDALPDRVTRATLALEDRRYFEHPGVDAIAIARAAWQNLKHRGRRSGASTIAMQIARMQQPAARGLLAKANEAATAVALTLRYGRAALLAHYLRIVPYGNGSHGIAHAARWYFEKPVADLSWAEIAILSAIPQSPTRMNPLRPGGLQRAVRRGHRMLLELARQNVIDAAELALAQQQLTDFRLPVSPRRPDALHAVIRFEGLGRTGRLSPEAATDPRIRTTLDLETQSQATMLAQRYLGIWRGAGAEQVAVMVVRRGSGEVLASVGSNDYRDRHSGALDFSRTLRSPGSTLKPFIYALALERGLLKASDIMADLPEGASGINNADGHFLGPMLPRQALANSRNVPATNLLRNVGLDTTLRFLRDLGLHDIEGPAENFGLSMAIGSLPTTLDRLMRAYGALADDGRLSDLVWHDGQPRKAPAQILSADTARLVTSFLADPMARLPSFPRFGPTEYPFPVALKTGTSQGYRDAWTIAWSKQFIVGVWLGRGDAGTMSQLSGASSAARLVHALMLKLHNARPGDLNDAGFPSPAGRVPVELCVFGGKRSAGSCGQTLTEWLKPEDVPAVEEASLTQPAEDGARPTLAIAAVHRAWAKDAGYPVADAAPTGGAVRLTIATPENNSRIWLNPETPPALNRIALKSVVEPRVPQVVWYVDGEPFAVTDPDQPVFWTVKPGTHTFQLRRPLQPGTSRTIQVVVE